MPQLMLVFVQLTAPPLIASLRHGADSLAEEAALFMGLGNIEC